MNDLYLDSGVRNACDELVEEQRRADILRAHGLGTTPSNSFGRTSRKRKDLACRSACLRARSSIVHSALRSCCDKLSRRNRPTPAPIIDYVRTEPCLLFFDEFDAIGKERGDIHETGEIKRVVTTLLLQLDDLPSYCVVVGATNHPELLDRATWRPIRNST